jgi:hypothetical protein
MLMLPQVIGVQLIGDRAPGRVAYVDVTSTGDPMHLVSVYATPEDYWTYQ